MKRLVIIIGVVLLATPFLVVTPAIAVEDEDRVLGGKDRENITTSRTSISGSKSADTYVPLVNFPGLAPDDPNRALPDLLNALFRILIGIGAMIAVIRIAFSGIKYMASETSISSKEGAKQDITDSVLGLLVLLSIFILLGFINDQLLNLNFLAGAQRVDITVISSGTGVTGGTEERKSTCKSELFLGVLVETTCTENQEEIDAEFKEFANECENDEDGNRNGNIAKLLRPTAFDHVIHAFEAAPYLFRYVSDQDSTLDTIFYCQPASGIETNLEPVAINDLPGGAQTFLGVRAVEGSVLQRILTEEEVEIIKTNTEKAVALNEEIARECKGEEGRENYLPYPYIDGNVIEYYCYEPKI